MGGLTQFDQQVDQDLLADLSADLDIPCDYSDQWFCPKEGAEWVLHGRCPLCDYVTQRLLCTSCKNDVLVTEHGCQCRNCEGVVFPFRRYVTHVEPLNRKVA